MRSTTDKLGSKYQLYASIFIGGFTGLNVGAVLGFSAILLPQLPREITLSDKSWLASICNLGQLVGALLAGFISNKIGRKHCLLLFTIPLICGWLTLIFNHENVILANLGRILQGFGMMPSIGQVYLIEVLDTEHRETFGSFLAIAISVGITLIYALGALLHWIIVAWIFIGFIVIQCIGLHFVPESPQWLMSQGYEEEAQQCLKTLRHNDQDVLKELETLKVATKTSSDLHAGSVMPLWREFLRPEAYKPLGFLICLWILQQFSGNFAIIFYAVDIFDGINDMKDNMMDHMESMSNVSYLSAISVGAIRIVGSVLGVVFLKKQFSRRLLMSVCGIGMFIAMSSLATVEHLKHLHLLEQPVMTALLVVSSSSFILFHSIGFNVIPMLLVGELCPVKLKSLTSGITIAIVAILVFTVVKVFPIAMAEAGGPMTYGFFAVICLLSAFFSYYFVPETRGKMSRNSEPVLPIESVQNGS